MLREDERTPFNLITLTKAGLSIAEYPQIREALIQRFKEIYGSDIDVSTTSADGIYIETMSLMINNLMQVIKMLYSELDIRTATGVYLDALCSLSGIYRKDSTFSRAVLLLTNTGIEKIEITPTSPLIFSDKNGNEWRTIVEVGQNIILESEIQTAVIVQSVIPGPLVAPKGWINQTLSAEYSLNIVQEEDAELGSYEESDAELRQRRNQSISAQGISVLESMVGALLNITGIDDVKVYNNDSVNVITANDGTLVNPHNVYVIIRKRKNISVNDNTIGTLIYEKLTPGIGTVLSNPKFNDTGISKNYKYTQYILGVPYENESLLQNIYWKEAKPLNSDNLVITIKIKIKAREFATNEGYTVNLISDAIKEYLNELSISEEFSDIDLINTVNDADPLFRGQKTFICQSVDLSTTVENGPLSKNEDDDNIVNYFARDTFFDTTSMKVNVYQSNEFITITISGETV